MWTQRDQIQAYQFLRRRLISALVTGDANHPTSPGRRLVLGTILGIGAAVLTAAAFGVIGLLSPSGSADWRQGGQVIVEKETGARYVLGQDGLLHPVLNYASARLLAGGTADQTVTVSSDTLRSASRGAMLGIPGAPDSLPASNALSATTFTSCTRTPPDLPAAARPVSTVVVGPSAPAGRALPDGQAVLVAPGDGGTFLVTGGLRYRIGGQAALAALGYEDASALPVAVSWLDTVPAGRDLDLLAVPDAGAPGPAIGGKQTLVGQVLGDGAFYLVRAHGVTPIGATGARLVLGDSGNAAAYPDGTPAVVTMSVAALDGAPRAGTAPAGYPSTLPRPLATAPTTAVCAVDDGDGVRITTSDRLPAHPTQVGTRTDARVADAVSVPPGTGALVREQAGAGGATGALYLITDSGQKYPVPSDGAAAALGYAGVRPAPVSGTELALLPTGPSLDPVAARQVVVAR
ncbi:MAG TPA: type VII secretion protein EccB [Pseudonocardiaceae bacterium]|nr:type VII secretion protein EccB [Pseudonocardiaceae bacterium]